MKNRPTTIALPLISLIFVFFLVGCDNNDDMGKIRVLHTSPDAPKVDVLLNNEPTVSELDYAVSSGYTEVDAQTYEVAVQAITPGGNVEVINVPALTVAKDSKTTILAVGTVSEETPSDIPLEAITVGDSASSPRGNQVAIRVVHASPTAGTLGNVDIYVTAPGGSLSTPVTLGYKEDIDLGAVPTDEYQIRITPNGDNTTILYDSGAVDLAPFKGKKLIIAAIDTTTSIESDPSDGAPVKLLVATDNSHLSIVDESTKTGARVVHLSPNAGMVAGGPVEVFASADGGMPIELIPTFNYFDIVPAANSYVAVAPADYTFSVAPDTNSVVDAVFTSDVLSLAQAEEYTVIAAGDVGGTPAFTLLPTQDNNRSIATQASVKVVHGAAAVGTVDVYVTAAGDFSVADVEGGMAGMPLLPDFEFGKISDYVAVAEGSYDIRVVDQASHTVVINVEGAPVSNGSVITAIAYGPDEADNDPATAGLMLLTN